MLKMMFRKCMNNPQTGGEEGLFYSQLPKLAVGAPTDTSWTPRAHGVPCARYTYRGHGVTWDYAGARGHGVGGNFVIFLSNLTGERKIGVWGRKMG